VNINTPQKEKEHEILSESKEENKGEPIISDATYLKVNDKLSLIRGSSCLEEHSKKKNKLPKLILCKTSLIYRVVKKSCRLLGYKFTDDDSLNWDLYWTDVRLLAR